MPFGLEYLCTLSFIITIAAIVQLTENGRSRRRVRCCIRCLASHLPLITTNCAVLGVPLLNVANKILPR